MLVLAAVVPSLSATEFGARDGAGESKAGGGGFADEPVLKGVTVVIVAILFVDATV